MKKFLLCLSCMFLSCKAFCQVVYSIRADSVRIYSSCDTAELIIENHTRNILGFLYNKGNGRTEFRKPELKNVGDTAIALEGLDTIAFRSATKLYVDSLYWLNDSLHYRIGPKSYSIFIPETDPTVPAYTKTLTSASKLLTEVETMDGDGSGMDADLLDGINSSGFNLQRVTDNGNTTSNAMTSSSVTAYRNNLGGSNNWDWGANVDGSWKLNNTGIRTVITALGSNGNIGIGTTNPIYGRLSVNGSDDTPLDGTMWSSSTGAGVVTSVYNQSLVAGSVAGIRLTTRYSAANTWNIYNISTGAGTGDLAIGSGTSGSPGSEALRITYNHNVGIGTTSPSDKLTVNGNISIGNASSSTFNGYYFKRNQGGRNHTASVGISATGTYNGVKISDNDGTSASALYMGSGGVLRFVPDGIGSPATSYPIWHAGNDGSGSGLDADKIRGNDPQWTTAGIDISNTNSGNIGIGIATPQKKLDVNGDVALSGILYGNNIFGKTTAGIDISTNTSAEADITLRTGPLSTPMLTIKSNGNVGIGTTSPVSKLHLYSNNNTDVAASLIAGQYYGVVVGTESSSDNYYALNVLGSINNATGNGTSLFMVRADGNVGIGTTDPSAKLDVRFNSGSRAWGIQSVATSDMGDNYIPFYKVGTSTQRQGYVGFGSPSNDDIYLASDLGAVHLEAAGTGRLTVDVNGNVGLSTNAPNSTLQVNGSFSLPIRVITSSTTLTESDYTILNRNQSSATASAISFPAASNLLGRIYKLVDNGGSEAGRMNFPANTVYFQGTSILKMSDIGPDVIAITVQSDGNTWVIIGTTR